MIYGFEFRDMQTGIHNVYLLKAENRRKAIKDCTQIEVILESLKTETNEFYINSYWHTINGYVNETVPVNFRNFNHNEKKYTLMSGRKVYVINWDNIPDVY